VAIWADLLRAPPRQRCVGRRAPPAPEGWRVLAETFPANFFLRGVNLQLKAKPPGLGRFMLGFGGATIGYDKDAMELINPTNKGWESRSYRFAVTVDYFFRVVM